MLPPRLRRELLWVVISQAAVLIGGLIAVKVLTNLMTAHAYGEFSLALTLAAGSGSLIYGPMSQVATRFYSVARERSQDRGFFTWLSDTYRYASIALTMCAIVAVAGALLWIDSRWAWLIAGATALSLATGANSVMVAMLNGMRMRGAMAAAQLADSLAKAAFMIVVVALLSQTSQAAVMASAAGAAVVTFFAYRYITGRIVPRTALLQPAAPSGAASLLSGEMTAYMLPFVALAVIGMVALLGDRWIIQTVSGESDVGIYSAMYQIVNGPLALGLSFINQYAYPIIFARAGDLSAVQQRQSQGDYRRVFLTSAALIVFMALVAYLFGEQILTIFTSKQFARHHNVLWILVVALSLFYLAQQMTVLGLANRQPSVYVIPKLAHSGVFLALAIGIGIHHGLQGIAGALAISSGVYFLLIYRANVRIGRQQERG